MLPKFQTNPDNSKASSSLSLAKKIGERNRRLKRMTALNHIRVNKISNIVETL
jgi:hypothetical protein